MSRITLQMREFARHLIAYETGRNSLSETKYPSAFLIGEKIRLYLTILMGKVGFSALLSRALILTTAEFSWLSAVHVKADGSLVGLDKLEKQVDPEEITEGFVALFAQLFELLMAFIGENLTVQLLRDLWPELSLHDLDSGIELKNEKTKRRS